MKDYESPDALKCATDFAHNYLMCASHKDSIYKFKKKGLYDPNINERRCFDVSFYPSRHNHPLVVLISPSSPARSFATPLQ
mmetsp:Transcript_22298/g.31213  ORF Transcript_22298/g.31213 Transcript_22298/m.31213 type:complete len:81 (+) Transcript_22298:285-527(+)